MLEIIVVFIYSTVEKCHSSADCMKDETCTATIGVYQRVCKKSPGNIFKCGKLAWKLQCCPAVCDKLNYIIFIFVVGGCCNTIDVKSDSGELVDVITGKYDYYVNDHGMPSYKHWNKDHYLFWSIVHYKWQVCKYYYCLFFKKITFFIGSNIKTLVQILRLKF